MEEANGPPPILLSRIDYFRVIEWLHRVETEKLEDPVPTAATDAMAIGKSPSSSVEGVVAERVVPFAVAAVVAEGVGNDLEANDDPPTALPSQAPTVVGPIVIKRGTIQ